jgi:chemotaxis protein MotA
MDILSILGLFLAVVAVVLGSILKGAGVAALVSSAAFVIVLVGTVASILIQAPNSALRRSLQMFGWIFKPPVVKPQVLAEKIVEWSKTARRKGLISLEQEIAKEDDPFVRRGLELVYDGTPPETIRKVLEIEMDAREQADMAGAKVFEGMGVYAPTLGIIGAVLGLMSVMQNLADPSSLGKGIAAAFVATVYGIGFANLFFLPVASKLKAITQQNTRLREMICEGMASIAEGENPRVIELRLQSYISQ